MTVFNLGQAIVGIIIALVRGWDMGERLPQGALATGGCRHWGRHCHRVKLGYRGAEWQQPADGRLRWGSRSRRRRRSSGARGPRPTSPPALPAYPPAHPRAALVMLSITPLLAGAGYGISYFVTRYNATINRAYAQVTPLTSPATHPGGLGHLWRHTRIHLSSTTRRCSVRGPAPAGGAAGHA